MQQMKASSFDIVLASTDRVAGSAIDDATFLVTLPEAVRGPVRIVLRDFVVSTGNAAAITAPLHVALHDALNPACYDSRNGGPTGHLATVAAPLGARREYPPAPLTADIAVLADQPYGNGMYVASISSTVNGNAMDAFDKAYNGYAVRTAFGTANCYHNNTGFYTGTLGNGAVMSGTPFLGEHLTLRLPQPVRLLAYEYTSHFEYNVRCGNTWAVGGSTDGTNWTLLDTRSDVYWTDCNVTQRFDVTSNTGQAFDRFRIVATRVGNRDVTNYRNDWGIAEWRLFGNPDAERRPPSRVDAGFVTDAAALLSRPLRVTVKPSTGIAWTPQDWSARLSVFSVEP